MPMWMIKEHLCRVVRLNWTPEIHPVRSLAKPFCEYIHLHFFYQAQRVMAPAEVPDYFQSDPLPATKTSDGAPTRTVETAATSAASSSATIEAPPPPRPPSSSSKGDHHSHHKHHSHKEKKAKKVTFGLVNQCRSACRQYEIHPT